MPNAIRPNVGPLQVGRRRHADIATVDDRADSATDEHLKAIGANRNDIWHTAEQ